MPQSTVRTGSSPWRVYGADSLPFPELDGDLSCDVAVIGGGITGALVSHALIKQGVHTVVLDKGEVGAGSTAASTGLLQYEIDTPLVDLIRQRGERDAVHAYRRGMEAITEVAEIAKRIECGFDHRRSLCFASADEHIADLRREFECRREFGFDLEYLGRSDLAQISSIDAPAALLSAGDAEVDPFRLTQGLLRDSAARGLVCFNHVEVTGIEERAFEVVLLCGPRQIKAKAVMFCTGYWAPTWLDQKVARLRSTFALSSRPMPSYPGWPDQCLIWETARPYTYLRQTPDGRAVIGGEDTESADDHQRDELLAHKRDRLLERFQRLFPASHFEPDLCWAGTFAETKDGLPYIGSPFGDGIHQRVFFALGYGGNGITFSVIAAKLLTDLFFQRQNGDAAVFRFNR